VASARGRNVRAGSTNPVQKRQRVSWDPPQHRKPDEAGAARGARGGSTQPGPHAGAANPSAGADQ